MPLSGWYLTDDATRLRKWPLPAWTIGAGRRIVIFASNRDRRPVQAVAGQDNAGTAAQPRLAANFKISSNAGRYLALTKEGAGGAVNVISAFNSYPKQVPDVSYGVAVTTTALVPANAAAKALVPTAGNGGDVLGAAWRGGAEPFNDAAWIAGTQGAGVAGAATVVGAANLKLRLNAESAATLTTDTSGAAHSGTNTGNTTSFMPAAKDTAASPLLRRGAMQFVAAAAAGSSQVVIPAHADFTATTGAIMFWMKSGQTNTAAGGSEGAMLWDRRTTSGNVLVLTAAANANPGRIFSQPSGGGSFYSTARVDDDQWHHIAFVYNQAAGGTDIFYVDGVASGQTTHGNAWTWLAAQQIELGRSHDGYWQKYHGLLDEVRFYNTALSAAQVAQIYNGADENVEAADLGLNFAATLPGNAGAFLRIPFTVANPATITGLRFGARRMRSIMDQYLQAPGTVNPLLEAMIDAHVARISTEVTLDRATWGWPANGGPYGFGTQPWATAIDQMKTLFLTPRRTHLFTTHTSTTNVGVANANSAGIPATPQPASVPITIASYDAYPAGSTTQDEEYVQLSNANPYAADISRWTLSGGVDFTFKSGTVINAGGSLYVSPRQVAFRARTVSPRGGEGRFLVGPYDGKISSRGELIGLRDAAGALVHSVATPTNPTAAQQSLRITELSYHPTDPTPAETLAIGSVVADDFEYLELLNTGAATLNLAGARFTKGVEFTFPAGTTLAPNARLVVVANIPAFQLRHGTGATVSGPFLGSLDNGGEGIEIVDPSGEVVLDFTYNDTWYPPTDGSGRTLVVRAASPTHTGYGQPTHWAISGSATGSPGTGDADFANHFTGWRWDHFTDAEILLPDGSENTALAGADANPDGDMFNNLGEYAFGTDPRSPQGDAIVGTGSVTIGPDAYATVTFRRRHKALDLEYDVQFSSDLAVWASTTEQTGPGTAVGSGMEEVTFRDSVPASGTRRYVRATASAP